MNMTVNFNKQTTQPMHPVPPPVVVAEEDLFEIEEMAIDLDLSDEARELVRAGRRGSNNQDMSHLFQIMRDQIESARQQAEAQGEQMDSVNLAITIASRIANGDNVPQKDRAFLIEHSPGMYMSANNIRMMRENNNPRDYDSALPDEYDPAKNAADAIRAALGSARSRSTASVSPTSGAVSINITPVTRRG